eukprot:CAMPEP_0202716074 /NCGR_PEP_ID=MMETSP1385-20130828/97016_1 /ASSEMBLY_ACC=CAM_ASM_000861 /TAXON_ID=933848 /ORGANISM="Elphidium margaritaceum" /LENGTH=266 /DNA_ID=CAMNT_0049377631 /DNA_START=24 /DNA_END=824 /DNA_ORIENTATION=-
MAHDDHNYYGSLSPDKYLRRNNDSLFSTNPMYSSPTHGPRGMDQREIGDEALSWELSSAKSGHGVQQLRDDNLTTFWQSDGMVPHKVTILFHKKQVISNVAVYTDYKLDESYTPQRIAIKASSSSLHNYENHIVCTKTLNEPVGWVVFPLPPHKRQNKNDKFLKTNKLIFEVRSSHQSGRDTHIRQIKIYAPNLNHLKLAQHNKSIFSHYALGNRDNHEDDEDDEDEDEELMMQPKDDETSGDKKQLVFESEPITSIELLQHQSLR